MDAHVICAYRPHVVATADGPRGMPPVPVLFVPRASVASPSGFDVWVLRDGVLRGAPVQGLPHSLRGVGGTLLVPNTAAHWISEAAALREVVGFEVDAAWESYCAGTSHAWLAGTSVLPLVRPLVMGIVNVTPDSFSDGGRFVDVSSAVAHGRSLAEVGADILDVGGESTRPGSASVGESEELARVLPVIRGLRDAVDVPISVDTRKAAVADAALEAGAQVVNDVSALRDDPEMVGVVARREAGLVLMHMRGQPATMQDNTHYEDLVVDVVGQLEESLMLAYDGGIDLRRVLVDPGIGFGKGLEENLSLVAGLGRLWALGRPSLLGASRKRFLGELTGRSVEDRDHATVAAVTVGVLAGAAVVRVHDAAAAFDALRVALAMRGRLRTHP